MGLFIFSKVGVMSKSVSAVTVVRKMTPKEADEFHIQKCGQRFSRWHKRRLSKSTSALQEKYGPGRTFNVGSKAARRARRAKLELLCVCGCKVKNCRCG